VDPVGLAARPVNMLFLVQESIWRLFDLS
jgi:hypothetical protein